MHPTISIASFIVFAGTLSLGGHHQLILGAILLISTSVLLRCLPDKKGFKMVWRMRWLFLSMWIIYLFATPGIPLFTFLPQITEQGVFLALQRCAVLIILILSIHLLLRVCSQQELLQGLYWLIWPLKFIGVNHKRMALRLTLTLQMASSLAENGFSTEPKQDPRGVRLRIAQQADALGASFKNAVEEKPNLEEIVIPMLDSPRSYAWLVPIFLLIVMLAVELPL